MSNKPEFLTTKFISRFNAHEAMATYLFNGVFFNTAGKYGLKQEMAGFSPAADAKLINIIRWLCKKFYRTNKKIFITLGTSCYTKGELKITKIMPIKTKVLPGLFAFHADKCTGCTGRVAPCAFISNYTFLYQTNENTLQEIIKASENKAVSFQIAELRNSSINVAFAHIVEQEKAKRIHKMLNQQQRE